MPAKFPGSRKRVDSIQLDVENYRRWMFIQHIAYFYFSLFTIPIPIFFLSFFAVDLISNFEKSSFKYDSKIDERICMSN